ncbi:MAG: aminotransferase class III-fold pyridoxal phosphate-dependent enzyme [Myxococcaceae bacterium]|nr:aminotransferase class III-fold pyridoxal phosphate-dependent enzyme [Myxococcaceae bacterium]
MSLARTVFKTWNPLWRAWARLQLSRAKHRSLGGHPRMALRFSRLVKGYAYDAARWFDADGATAEVTRRRRDGLARLSAQLATTSPRTLEATRALEASVSDLAFTNHYRVPFQFRDVVAAALPVGAYAESSDGIRLRDLDGVESLDLGGSYGVNLFGTDFYKQCLARAFTRAQELGLVLGPYHPVITDNVERLKALSGMDEVSFHMSGTEAVMQAVRLARYHSKKRYVVRFCGAYHGWWDGVQVGPGNPLPNRDVLTLPEQAERTLGILRMRDDIACVLVNPLQAMTPNASPSSDSALVGGERKAHYDKAAYTKWLKQLREVCTEKGIALVFDEVFLGFRLARGGAQEYFGVKADLVTWGKTLGGGLPVGVVCGPHRLMKRFRDDHPADICFARGTFNSHPYVMTAMNEFLTFLDTPKARDTWENLDARWDARAASLNAALEAARVPVRMANMTSVFVTRFLQPGRYHWMLQFYLRAQGLSLSWIGSARFIFSHDWSDEDFAEASRRIVAACQQMEADGWFLVPAEPTARVLVREMIEAFLGRRPTHAAALPMPEAPTTAPDRLVA